MSEVVQLERRRARPEDAKGIETWLRRLAAQTDRSWESLCRDAGVPATSVTRFLRHGYPIPKMTTLGCIARVAGVAPPDQTMTTAAQPLVDVPVIAPSIFGTQGIGRAMELAVETMQVPAKLAACVGVKITADTGSLAGVLVGDLVVVDPGGAPVEGSLVVAVTPAGAGVYRVRNRHLVAQSVGNHAEIPVRKAKIVGVARHVQRVIG